ncbi:MAG: YggT family protein [Ruminococcaceae bacterium]|nr:YggT family protein [Oscillospiraceae bacterium]
MNEIYYVISTVVLLILSLVELAMLARALLSWFLPDGGGLLPEFIYLITEPLILPFRRLFERFGWFQNSPLDIAYLCAVLALGIVTTFLSAF